ncbi:MAG: polysaccharide biosynthesis tyrosine autokinase [Proteobacteria bacterium]|nr:polysaccharide biosynthesis tyrosine autokinase [Pseudomonadota bacterium]
MKEMVNDFLQKIKKKMSRNDEPAISMLHETYVSDDEKQKAGWVSHTYTKSRAIELDTEFCMENRCIAMQSETPEMDSYRVLRTHILQMTKHGTGNTIMVTSALPGEGKSTTAINLAFALAKDYKQTVLLVDCDLRRQSVHHRLGIKSGKGLIDYLLNDTPVSELILWPGIEKLTIISGGRPFLESSELLGSLKMQELVEDMKNRYPDRYVLFDAPPILASADSLTFIPLVDHVLLVVQAEKTSVDDVQKAVELIPKEKMLGIVLNRVKSPSSLGYSMYYPSRR